MGPDGNRETHSSKEEIEEICMEENKQKFLRTDNTPCIQEPLFSLLGVVTTPSCNTRLDNTFCPPGETELYTAE